MKKAKAQDKVQYDSKQPISEQDVFLAFQVNNKKLEKELSKALKEMKADGSFGKIMSKAN